jgi:hypothetical protein
VISGKLSEVAPPLPIQELRASLDRYAPQVTILDPNPDQLFEDTTVEVRLQVSDLPVFQDPDLGLGSHLSLVLDNEPEREIYDLTRPVTLENLSPGTHTLRVFASRPWHESFKNDGAYARTTFHVKTKTGSNSPDPKLPLLTYNRPSGVYGAQPILLDFYLANAPLHLVARESESDEIEDWRVRVTVNGESFLLDTWEPIYLQGFEKGDNLVKLEFIDEKGNLVENVFNTTARLISYDPNYEDSLTRLVKGEIPSAVARQIVDPNYTATPVQEEETPTAIEEPIEKPPVMTEETTEETPTVTEEPIETPPVMTEQPIGEPAPEPVALPRLSLPEELENPEPAVETLPVQLPRLVLPEDIEALESPESAPVTLPRLVLPDESEVMASEPTAPPNEPEVIEPIAPPTLPIEEKPDPEPTSEPGKGLFDRARDTFSRWRSARGSEPVQLPTPDRSPSVESF